MKPSEEIKLKRCSTCVYYVTWSENQAPLGSGLYWPEHFTDCECPDIPDEFWDKWEFGKDKIPGIDIPCPYHKPLEIKVCPKHGEYFERDGCEQCLEEEYERMYREAREDVWRA